MMHIQEASADPEYSCVPIAAVSQDVWYVITIRAREGEREEGEGEGEGGERGPNISLTHSKISGGESTWSAIT